jgi:regulator of protease activity HflC (stomatin/prohibitin superfamily)
MSGKLIAGGVIGFIVLVGGFSSYYSVSPNELAAVTYLGKLESDKPVGPGPHFKLPFLEHADIIEVSQQTLHLEKFLAGTADNQRVTVSANFVYKVPESAVFHMLYGVGRSGAGDINNAMIPVVKDRIGRVISRKNMNTFNVQREEIQNEILKEIQLAFNELYQVDLLSFQFTDIVPSDAFIQSNDQAVLAKNEAIKQENNVRVVEFQAQQQVARAEGEAKVAVAAAEGAAKSQVARANAEKTAAILQAEGQAQAKLALAEAEAKASELRGGGESKRLAAESGALGGPANYLAFQQIMQGKTWSGPVPQSLTIMGGTPTSVLPYINLGQVGK